MKTVQDKDGNVIEVAVTTPCHAGVNGALPIMLDSVKDFRIFDDMAAKEVAWEANKVARETYNMATKIRQAYLSLWPAHKQLEAFQDKLNGESTKLDKMNLDFAKIKAGA